MHPPRGPKVRGVAPVGATGGGCISIYVGVTKCTVVYTYQENSKYGYNMQYVCIPTKKIHALNLDPVTSSQIWLLYELFVYTYQKNSCAKLGSSHHLLLRLGTFWYFFCTFFCTFSVLLVYY